MEALGKDYTPLTDWRASADYRLAGGKKSFASLLSGDEGEEPVRLDRKQAV
jgi:xanthine dehydrogenase small subunit